MACDNRVVAYIISYMLPLASILIKDFNLYISLVIVGAIVLIAPFVNTAVPNPLLMLQGYHFYEVETENGATYVLISKRKLRSNGDVKRVKRVFEFLLLDEEHRNV